jgi:hypothetical protein
VLPPVAIISNLLELTSPVSVQDDPSHFSTLAKADPGELWPEIFNASVDVPDPPCAFAAVFNSAISVHDDPFQDSFKLTPVVPGFPPPKAIADVNGAFTEPLILFRPVFKLATSVQEEPSYDSAVAWIGDGGVPPPNIMAALYAAPAPPPLSVS